MPARELAETASKRAGGTGITGEEACCNDEQVQHSADPRIGRRREFRGPYRAHPWGKKEDLGARASLNMRAIIARRVRADNRHATKSGFGRPNGGCTCRIRCTGAVRIVDQPHVSPRRRKVPLANSSKVKSTRSRAPASPAELDTRSARVSWKRSARQRSPDAYSRRATSSTAPRRWPS
jgi:hypothetical protein